MRSPLEQSAAGPVDSYEDAEGLRSLSGWTRSRRGRVALVLSFILISGFVYGRRLTAPLTSDAGFLAYRNAWVTEPAGIARFWTADYFAGAMTHGAPYLSGYYRPITNMAFWLEYRWAGTNDLPYNVTEVVLHGVNAFLVAMLVGALAGGVVGMVAGLLFVVHPVHAFAATEAAARADVLFAAFYLLAMLVFDRALRRSDDARAPPLALAGVTLLYLLSVLSKEMGITLPATLGLLVALRHVRDGTPLRRLLWTVPMWVAGGAYVLWRFVVLDLDPASMGYTEAHSRAVLLLAALKTIPVHLSRLILPLYPSYPELNPQLFDFVSRPLADPLTYLALWVVGALALAALLWRRSPRIAFWAAFFMVSFSPLLKVDNIGGTVDTDLLLTQERWIYLPSVAVVALVALGLVRLYSRARGPGGRRAIVALTSTAALALGWTASVHAGRHDDPFALLRSLYLIPEDRIDRMQRANRLMLYANLVAVPQGQHDDAEARVREASRLVPDSPLVALNVARVLVAREKWDDAWNVLSPWMSPDAAALAAHHQTNFRVYDDLNRAGPEIPLILARVAAEREELPRAASLLCEALRRHVEPGRVAALAWEIWLIEVGDDATALVLRLVGDPAGCEPEVVVS